MTTIFCSNKLKQLLGPTVSENKTNLQKSPIGDWNGHLFSIDKRKCLAFVNNQTYYSIFFADILKRDLTDFHKLFTTKLINQLIYDNIIGDSEVTLIKKCCSQITLLKTNNDKKTIGIMNDLIYQFKVHRFYKYPELNQMDVCKENSLINESITKPNNYSSKNFSIPKKAMKELIKTCAQHAA
jgi:hypothetical protein